jgi:hypothetical protein
MAGSCASYIMLACETIVAEENSTIFIHNPLIEYASGNKNDLSKIVNELEKLEQIYVDAYVLKTGKDEQTIRIAMDDETTFTSQEAKDFGLVDEILIRSENQNEKTSATKGFYRFVAQYFSQQKQSFKDTKSQEQNQKKGKTEMEIKDVESLIAVLTSLKDLDDVEAIKAEIDNIIGAVENLEIKEKEAEPTEEEKPEETPEPAKEDGEDVQAKIDEAVAKAKADIMAEAEARFNAMLLAKTDSAKAQAKSHSEVYNSMVAGADKSAYFKAHKNEILLGK